MKFCIVYNDSWLYHCREVYLCDFNEDYKAWVQWPIAAKAAVTAFGARRWVSKQISEHLRLNGCIDYIEG